MFDPFFTTKPNGTGLGLWVVYRLIQSITYDTSKQTLRQSIEEAERKAISEALAKNSGLINQTADSLGISRKSLWEKMKRYGIQK